MLIGIKADAVERAVDTLVKDLENLQSLLKDLYKSDMEEATRIMQTDNTLIKKQIFSAQLKRLRKEAGMTQKTLAEKIGVQTCIIGRYECAKTMPRPKAIKKLAAALNIPDSQFFITPRR